MEINVNKGANWTFNQFLAVDQIQGVPWQNGQSIDQSKMKEKMYIQNFY